MALTYKFIASSTVGAGGTTSIDFTNIPQTYTDLILKVSARDLNDNWLLNLQINNTDGNQRMLNGSNSAVTSLTYTDMRFVVTGQSGAASVFSSDEFYFPNYTSTSISKSVCVDGVAEDNSTTQGYCRISANLWSSTAAITSLKIKPLNATNIPQYSTAYLYGILKA